jgi:hypothetical protein
MKRATLMLAALALLLGGVGQAKADVVYDDGAISGSGNRRLISSTNGEAYSLSDSFTVAGLSLLTGAQHVGIDVSPGATPLTVNWSIGTTPFASDISAGTSNFAGTILARGSYGSDLYDESFTLNGTVNAGTTYYLTLSNATASDGNGVYWDVNYGASSAEQQIDGNYPFSVPAESFQLLGNAPSVPEPSSLTLLGIGGLWLAGCAWRRRHAAAPVG